MNSPMPPPPPPPFSYSAPPPPPPTLQGYAEKPRNHLALAIVSLVVGLTPFGIVAVVQATRVDGHWFAGRYAKAHEAARKAQRWAIAAFATAWVPVAGFALIVGLSGGDQESTYPSAREYTTTTVEVTVTSLDAKPVVNWPGADVPTLKVTELRPGTGEPSRAGDAVRVYYVGVNSLDGVEFDSNFGSGMTFDFTLGSGRVIEGFDRGLTGVQTGGHYQLDIPWSMAYGEAGQGSIGPREDLTFVVDVVDVTP